MTAKPPPSPDPLQDRTMVVETPELVPITYPLAGPGSRFAAFLLDLLLVVVFVYLVPLLAIATSLSGTIEDGWLLAIMVLFMFVGLWGYFFFFEAFRGGQTFGKRWMSIRVVMEGGYPITIEAAAIRTLVRTIDLQLCGMVGGVFALLSSRGQRLGDMAASTVVVREVPADFPARPKLPAADATPRFSEEGFKLLERYMDRRYLLEPGVRRQLAEKVAPKFTQAEPPLRLEPADKYLERLYAEESARRLAARLPGRAGSAAASSQLRSRRDQWATFRNRALGIRGRRLASLGEAGVGEFAARYRELAADLARARTYGASPDTLRALESAAGTAHNLLYRPARRRALGFLAWLGGGFPRLARRRWVPISLAAAFLFGPAFISYALVRVRPDLERLLVDTEMLQRAEAAPARRAAGEGYIDVELGHAFLATAIVSNNIQVSFLAFATGITAGVLTAVVLVMNGLHLGSVLASFHNRQALDVIGTFVAPHGVIELVAIAIAGGAGLWMGSALLLPGRHPRRVALAARARESISLIGGVAILLIVAGLIEGFISPARIDGRHKMGFAILAASALALYLGAAGRRDRVRDGA